MKLHRRDSLAGLTTTLVLAACLPGCEDGGAPAPAGADAGRTHFLNYCSACHQVDGLGTEDGAPPLVGSPWVVGADRHLIRIALHGLHGPIEVGGKTYDLEMPGFAPVLGDDQLAALLSFVREHCGGSMEAITPRRVGEVRAADSDRGVYWTVEELLRD